MKKYFLLLVFFTVVNFLVSFIPKIKVEINTIEQNSLKVKAQESPFLILEEGSKFSVPKQEELQIYPHCISLDGATDSTSLMIQDINSKYSSGYRLKGFGISSRNPDSNRAEGIFPVSKYMAILCIDN